MLIVRWHKNVLYKTLCFCKKVDVINGNFDDSD